ncbi:MAG TPA: subclass B3 metallo-beta-lactamase [Bryobacteraceae bacterium]|nr:subclass B3 metallo-beta-lactamase [Bryobacteraceae bacterium]
MRLFKHVLCMLVALVAASAQTKQAKQAKTDWNTPFPAHKVIGNVYYVGSSELASFLITTPQGHILINSDFEATIPVIRASVEKLGFKFTDIKIILGSHAHGDHMEGDALAKELSGARVMAMEQDVPWLRKMTPGGKPHPIDQVLKDGAQVTLGGTTLTAHLTAGHTPGCTTWTTKAEENGKSYNVLIVCSVGFNPGYVLVNNKDYPSIADDYVRSFKLLRTLPVDVFLGAHGSFYGLQAKYARLQQGGANPFIDPAGFKAYVDDKEKAFNAELAAQKAKQ